MSQGSKGTRLRVGTHLRTEADAQRQVADCRELGPVYELPPARHRQQRRGAFGAVPADPTFSDDPSSSEARAQERHRQGSFCH